MLDLFADRIGGWLELGRDLPSDDSRKEFRVIA
jgi:hypothetical protein